MEEFIRTLNENSGAIVAVTATVSAILTILLLLDARSARNLGRVARLDARAKNYPPASFLLELDVCNYGPANARDVVILFHLTAPDGAVAVETRRQAETLLGVGEARKFLPGTPSGTSELNGMADLGLTLHVEWSWADDRRRLWFFPKRHEQKRTWATVDLRRDFFGGWALTERDGAEDLHEMADQIREIEGHLKAQRKVIEAGVKTFTRSLDNVPRQEALTYVGRVDAQQPALGRPTGGRLRRARRTLRRWLASVTTPE